MPPLFSEATIFLLFLGEAQCFGQIFHLLATMTINEVSDITRVTVLTQSWV